MKKLQVFLPVVVVMVFSSACIGDKGEEGREYSIPDRLCKIDIDASLYRPLFPPGETLSITDYNDEMGDGTLASTGECIVEVDDEQVIFIEIGAVGSAEHPSVEEFVRRYPDGRGNLGTFNTDDAQRVAGSPRETWVWPNFAVTSTLCESSNIPFSAITVSARLDWVGEEDYSEELKNFIVPFAAEQVRRIGERTCTPA
jgi:hypothetical protein